MADLTYLKTGAPKYHKRRSLDSPSNQSVPRMTQFGPLLG